MNTSQSILVSESTRTTVRQEVSRGHVVPTTPGSDLKTTTTGDPTLYRYRRKRAPEQSGHDLGVGHLEEHPKHD